MSYILHKLSAPGWTKKFTSAGELKEELYQHICAECREGSIDFGGPCVPVYSSSDLSDMLTTACGSEFLVENAAGDE
jgi:hypothetical protein